MMKLTALIIVLLFAIPAWSMDSKEMEEILKSIVETNSYEQENGRGTEISVQDKKDKTVSESAPLTKIPASPSPGQALLNSGIKLFEAAFYNNAKDNFERFRKEFPESNYRDLAAIWLSKIYEMEKDPDKAENILKTIGRDSGEFPTALSSLGKIYLRKGDDAKAIEYFYSIVSSFPDHDLADDSLVEIVKLYTNNNKGSQAIEAAIKIIKNYRERETLDDAYYLIARVFEKDIILKDFSIARKIYQIFLNKAKIEKDPVFLNSPLIKKVEKNLHNIEITYYGKIISS